MLYGSEINRLVRIGVIALITTIAIAAFLHLLTQSENFSIFLTFWSAIFSILVVPPFNGYIQEAFSPQEDVQHIVRARLKDVWIEGYLRTEERAIVSSTLSSNKDDIAKLDNVVCEMPVVYDAYPTDARSGLQVDVRDNVIKFLPGAEHTEGKSLAITEDDSLITIFDKFTRIVRKDDSVTGEFILVLGNRGTRKTLQLLRLAEHLVDRDSRVPIYLNLFSWAAGSKRFDLWLKEEISSQYDVLGEQAEKLIKNNYFILLLDGFEEVPFDRREHLVKSLSEFLQFRIDRTQHKHFPRHEIDTNGDASAPVDLRDAVVITSLFPVQWMDKKRDDPSSIVHKHHSNYYLSQPPYENFLDLHHHIQSLVYRLQTIEDRTNTRHKSPVAILKVRKSKESDVVKYMRCHFHRKVIQGQLIVDGVDTLAEYEEKHSAYERRKLDSISHKIADEQIEKLKENPLYPKLQDVLRRSPFLLRAFISTYTYTPDVILENGTLVCDIVDGATQGNGFAQETLDKIASEAHRDLRTLGEHLPELARQLSIDDGDFQDETTNQLDASIRDLWGKINESYKEYIYKNELDANQKKDLNETLTKIYNYLAEELDVLLPKDVKALLPERERVLLPEREEDTKAALVKRIEMIIKLLRRRYQEWGVKLQDDIRKAIINTFVENALRNQPGNIGPLNPISRKKMLDWIAVGMTRRRQRVLDRGDVVFYLEDVGQRIIDDTDTNTQENRDRRLEYKGYVTIITVFIFFMVYGFYLLLLWLLAVYSDAPSFPSWILGVVAVLLLFFARSFGWYSTGPSRNNTADRHSTRWFSTDSNEDETEDRARLNYPVRWYMGAGIWSGLFMGVIVGLIFFGVSDVIYGEISREPLRFEAAIVGLFAFALFFLLGGLEMGRRYAIVAHPEDGQRFLLITTVFASTGWLSFFFVFLFWPRTRFDLLTPQQIIELLPLAGFYSLATGLFIGVISAFVFSHLYLRHIYLYDYLRRDADLRQSYQQVLQHNVDVGLIRRVGGGYIFRHRLIMDYFSDENRI